MVSVPRLWPGETFVCIGSGPSLTPEDVQACQWRARVIAVNDAYRLAPWADVLYACDAKWWRHHGPLTMAGPALRFSLEPGAGKWAHILRNTGVTGLETEPTGLRTGCNSGYQAINLAVHLGAKTIVLLGYDMGAHDSQDHWFGAHPWKQGSPPYHKFLEVFPSILPELSALGITLVNASRRSALTCVPCVSLAEALGALVSA